MRGSGAAAAAGRRRACGSRAPCRQWFREGVPCAQRASKHAQPTSVLVSRQCRARQSQQLTGGRRPTAPLWPAPAPHRQAAELESGSHVCGSRSMADPTPSNTSTTPVRSGGAEAALLPPLLEESSPRGAVEVMVDQPSSPSTAVSACAAAGAERWCRTGRWGAESGSHDCGWQKASSGTPTTSRL